MANYRNKTTSEKAKRDASCAQLPRGLPGDLTPSERARLEALTKTLGDLLAHAKTEMLKVALPSSMSPNERNRIFDTILRSNSDEDGTIEHKV